MAESRRTFLSMTAAGLAAPLLQACGGGDSVAQPPLPTGAYPDYVPWMREAILDAIGTGDSAVSVALLDDDRIVYELELLLPDGRVIELKVDARTGAWLSLEGKRLETVFRSGAGRGAAPAIAPAPKVSKP